MPRSLSAFELVTEMEILFRPDFDASTTVQCNNLKVYTLPILALNRKTMVDQTLSIPVVYYSNPSVDVVLTHIYFYCRLCG